MVTFAFLMTFETEGRVVFAYNKYQYLFFLLYFLVLVDYLVSSFVCMTLFCMSRSLIGVGVVHREILF